MPSMARNARGLFSRGFAGSRDQTAYRISGSRWNRCRGLRGNRRRRGKAGPFSCAMSERVSQPSLRMSASVRIRAPTDVVRFMVRARREGRR
jgi:hypothetical protein